MSKKTFFILTTLFLILGIFIIYLNIYILPLKVKAFIVKTISEQTNRTVTLRDIKYSLLRGMVLKDLTIYDEPRLKSAYFLSAKEISFNFLILPLLKERKIIIPALNVDTVKFNLQKNADGTWNIPALSLLNVKSKFSVFIYKINISKAEGLIQDQAIKPVFTKKVKELNLRAYLSLNQGVNFNSILRLESFPQDTYAALKGVYNLKNRSLSAVINTKGIILNDYKSYFSALPVSLNEGSIPQAKIDLNLNSKFDLSVKSDATLKNINLTQQAYNLIGDANLNLNFSTNIKNGKNIIYSGFLEVLKAQLSGLPQINSLSNLTGRINFSTDKIEIVKIKGTALNCPAEFNGTITEFQNPVLNLNVSSDIDLIKLKDIIAQKISTPSPEGKAVLSLNLQYMLKNNMLKGYQGSVFLSDSSFLLPSLNEKINNLSARINFDDKGLNWQDASFDFKDIKFSSRGSLSDFKHPVLDLGLSSNLVNLKSKFNVEDKIIRFSSLKGNLRDSDFDIKGTLVLDPPEIPLLNISGNLKLELADIKDMPLISEPIISRINKFNPRGALEATFTLKARPQDWKNCNLDLDANSKLILLAGLKFENIILNYKQKDTLVNVFKIAAKFYDGDLNLDGNAKLESNEGAIYTLNLSLDNAELAKLKMDTPLKEKDISGVVNFFTQIAGKGKDMSAIRGKGKISLANGNIWEIGPFKGLVKYLFRPEFREKIIFKEVTADFIIKNKQVLTDNLYLSNPDLNLMAQGKVGFNGNLDFRANIEIEERLAQKTFSEKIRPFLSGVGKFIIIRATGKISEPKFLATPASPGDVFRQFKGFLKNRKK